MDGAKAGPNDLAAAPQTAESFRFSTDFLPERERVAMFREVFARKILGMDVEPLSEQPFRTEMTVKQLPGLDIVWAHNSAVRATRTRELIADGKDGFAFQWSASPGYGENPGGEITLAPHDGILISCSDPGDLALPLAGPMVSLTFPREALGPMLKDWSACAATPVPASTPALALLTGYIEILKRESATVTPELQKLAVAHVYDLLALALGPTREAIENARRGGLRAARLGAIKVDIAESMDAEFSIDAIAARHRLSSRHVQRLFEETGTTFTEFVRDQRLLRAHRMLISRRFDHKRISDIALDLGFGDLSHFNRAFRRRFGMSPGDVRKPS